MQKFSPLNPCEKGTGDMRRLPDKPWNLLAEEVSLPAAIIYQSKWNNNLRWMQDFANIHGVHLAPHGKTTMIPDFWHKQIEAGAWGITLATAVQVATAARSGIKTILMANQLVGKRNMEIIAALPSDLAFYCLVDSMDNVHQLGSFFAQTNRSLNLLIEIGIKGGRCGCRTEEEAIALSGAIAKYKCLNLAGIEFYEGIIHGENLLTRIQAFLQKIIAITEKLSHIGAFSQQQIIVSGAGSAWYDQVSNMLQQTNFSVDIMALIRPGCYLIHDQGICEQAQTQVMTRLGAHTRGSLQSCLEVWSYVQSRPEPGLAIVNMGKRDVAFSDGLPKPALHFRPGHKKPSTANPALRTVEMMDQHAYIQIPEPADLKVGDMLSFSTSHPCLTFDKWRQICIVNDDYEVIQCVDSFF